MGTQVTRRSFLELISILSKGMAAGLFSASLGMRKLAAKAVERVSIVVSGEDQTLYNGIRLSPPWPPIYSPENSRWPRVAPYLMNRPDVIPIDVGRQLFVDDFLVLDTTLKRTLHRARLHDLNPVLKPETPLEMNGGLRPLACPFNDGVFYDPQDGLFKLWYHAGWFDGIAYATSRDGLHWERPNLDVEPGTNRVLVRGKGYMRDGVGVWLDQESLDPNQRFKMFVYFRGPNNYGSGEAYTSTDGIHWSEPIRTGPCGDNTTIFYNPFRKVWVYSIRSNTPPLGRLRSYREHPDFITGADWGPPGPADPGGTGDLGPDVFFWAGPDDLDLPAPDLGYPTQLYNLDAAGYESLMLGLFAIHRGPPNGVCWKGRFPKLTELCVGFSRDGFHWHRPDRRSFIGASRKEGTWNQSYVLSAGGCCLVVGDKLYFYFCAFSGESPKLGRDMYAGGSTGLATLRRDGFCSMDTDSSGGVLTTRSVRFTGRRLFVNLDAPQGDLRVEIIDEKGVTIPPFSKIQSVPVSGNQTLAAVNWKGVSDLSKLEERPVRFRFYLRKGRLYSFWVSPDASGSSRGSVAAGGPGFTGPMDTVGRGGL